MRSLLCSLLSLVAATSLEELVSTLPSGDLEAWRSIFEAAGRGEHRDATAAGAQQPLWQLDADFGLRLREEELRERLRSFKQRPSELLKLVNEPHGRGVEGSIQCNETLCLSLKGLLKLSS